jgi:hypothetical protein
MAVERKNRFLQALTERNEQVNTEFEAAVE